MHSAKGEDTLKKLSIHTILYLAMLLMAGLLILSVSRKSHQAAMSLPFPVHFTGDYSENGGEWQTLDAETDLSAYHKNVTLRGRFDTELPEGAELRFYLNHIGMEIYRDGEILWESSLEKVSGHVRQYLGVVGAPGDSAGGRAGNKAVQSAQLWEQECLPTASGFYLCGQ